MHDPRIRLTATVWMLFLSSAFAQNVGIGTTTPGELLDVAGKARVQELQVTTGAVAGHVLTADAQGNATWQAAAGGGGGLPSGSTNDTLRCLGGTSWAATDDLVITSTGRVGIGDTTPHTSYDLTVGNSGLRSDGTINLITGRLGVGMTSTPSSSFDLDIGSSGFRSSGSDNVITGQLGVSRSSDPSYDLHVDGSARVDYIGVNTNPSSSYKLYVSGGVRFSSLSTGSGTTLVVSSSGDVRKQSSSRRYKDDIRDLPIDSERLLQLRPVSYRWKPEHGGDMDVGLIAEEVAALVPELVVFEPASADAPAEVIPEAVRYDKLAVYLLGHVAKQDETVKQLSQRVAELEEELAHRKALEARLARLESLLGAGEEDR